MKKLFLVLMFALAGCATLQPGADPIVVRAEQLQTTAEGAFDLVLSVDHADRGFWKTNAPAFHSFAEYLRVSVAAEGIPGRAEMPRYIAAQFALDNAKLAYKAAKGASSSNALFSAIISMDALAQQSLAWRTIVSTKPK